MTTPPPNLSQLRHWLLTENDAPFIELARTKKSVLSQLTALSYDLEEKVSSQAISVTGLVAKIIADRDPEYIRNYILRLFWLVNDESGGICWKAPELIGEILHHCPQFSQFFPMLVSLLDLEKEDGPRFRVGTLRAIGRVAQVEREAMLPAFRQVQVFTSEDQETATREMAIWCQKQLGLEEH